ncbi:MAG: hypothetical protein K2K57_02410 [Oscillospiraceae bacterium]|nr:hypothetical protein [Oscillospiraceae bacterium]
MKKIISTVTAALMIMGMVSFPENNMLAVNVSAQTSAKSETNVRNGWYKASGGERMYYKNGEKIAGKTALIDNSIYLFDSKGYLLTGGFNTINGKKYYSDKDGKVRCNQWVGSAEGKNGNTYYYAASSGVIKEYKFIKQSDSKIYMYVDGKKSEADDIPLIGTYNMSDYIDMSKYDRKMRRLLEGEVEIRCGYFKVGSHFYHLNYSTLEKCVVCDYAGKSVKEDVNRNNNHLFDLGSGKELGHVLGVVDVNSKGFVSDGVIINTNKHCSYVIMNNEIQRYDDIKAFPIIITDCEKKLNSVGGLDYSLTIVNNSGKTINYIDYTVHVVNKVGDTVSDTISRDTTFYLQDTGPYAPNETSSGIWEAMMYNYSAYDVVIDEVTIKYNDNTSVTFNGKGILSTAVN